MVFLLAAPTINPIVIWATWTAFRDQPEIVVLRVVFSLLIATIVGWVFSAQADLRPLLQTTIAAGLKRTPTTQPKEWSTQWEAQAPDLLRSGTFLLGQPGQAVRMDATVLQATLAATSLNKPLSYRWHLLLENTVQELRELGAVLILGSAIAAFIQVLIPREVILSLGAGPITSIVAMMLLAGLVSICSTVDSFFALSFASMFTSGSLLAFLVFGPMIDLKGVGLLLSIFKPKAVIYLFALAAQLTFLLTLFINLHVI